MIAHELRLIGCHGMAAHRYDDMLAMVADGRLAPERLLGRSVTLEGSIGVLTTMDRKTDPGLTVIAEF